MTTGAAASKPVLIDLALQGGGSHGAFTWGVLDRVLEEPRLEIAAISGTSAGTMNAAVLADGWIQGGAKGARAALDLRTNSVAPSPSSDVRRLCRKYAMHRYAYRARHAARVKELPLIPPELERVRAAPVDIIRSRM
jgi:predicted acylesterase/phospholipase RssA